MDNYFHKNGWPRLSFILSKECPGYAKAHYWAIMLSAFALLVSIIVVLR